MKEDASEDALLDHVRVFDGLLPKQLQQHLVGRHLQAVKFMLVQYVMDQSFYLHCEL